MKWTEDYTFFLFDFDGLLVNTEILHFEAYKKMCRARGFDLKWDFKMFCNIAHFSSDGLKKQIYEDFPELFRQEPKWDVLYKEKKIAYQSLLHEGKLELMPGVHDLLTYLSSTKKTRCVVTNSAREQINLIKEKIPLLTTIPYWITREDYQNPKPEPDGYLKALELYGKAEDKIIGFEDSIRGMKALEGAGIKPVVISSYLLRDVKAELFKKKIALFTNFEEMSQLQQV